MVFCAKIKRVKLGGNLGDFEYLSAGEHYFDSACQSLRPQPVIDALNDYYLNYNSCGERVKYAWGRKVDEKVEESRAAVLDLLKLKSRDYFVSFTLNTTYGLNPAFAPHQ
jgi:cysteine desulfurase/selenocysteine lyase